MAINLNDDWYKKLQQQEKERVQKIEKSKEYEAKGIPHKDRLAVRYDTTDKKTKKFVDSKGTSDGKTSKWRTNAVEGLSSKKYGRKYNDRLKKVMDEAGIPEHDRYGFMKWMDAQEKGIQSINEREMQPAKLTEQQRTALKAPQPKGIDWREHAKQAKQGEISSSSKKQNSAKSEERDGILGFLQNAADEVNRFQARAIDALSFGQATRSLEKSGREGVAGSAEDIRTKRQGAGGVTDTVADIAGLLGGGIGATTATRAAGLTGKGIKELAEAQAKKQLTKEVVKRGAKSAAGEGALIGGGLSAIDSGFRLAQDPEANLEDEAKNVLLNTLLGTVADPLLTAGLPALRMASNNAMQRGINNQLGDLLRNTDEQLALPAPQLQLPAPRQTNPLDAFISPGGTTATRDPLSELTLPKSVNVDRTDFFNRLNADPRYREVQDPILDVQKRIGETDWKSKEYGQLQDELLSLRASEASVRAEVENDIKRNILAEQMGVDRSIVDQLIARRDGTPAPEPELRGSLDNTNITSSESISSSPRRSNEPSLVRATPLEELMNAPIQRQQMNRSNVDDALDNLLGTRVREEADRLVGQEPTLPRQPVEDALDQNFVDRSIKKEKTPRAGLTGIQKQFTNDLAPVRQIDEAIKDLDANGTLNYLNPKTTIKARKKQLASNSSLEKSLTNAKGAHSVAAKHVTDRFSGYMKKLNTSKVSQEDLEKYAFARHGLSIHDSQAVRKQELDGMTEELARLEQMGDTDEANMLREMIEDFTMYQLPKGATREVLAAQADELAQNPELVGMYDEFMALQRENLSDMYDGGLISKELFEKLSENETYIPMKRNLVQQDLTGIASRRPQTPLNRMTETGSEEMIKSPIQEAIRNAYVTRFNIEKNKALQVVPKFARIDKEHTMFKAVQEPNANSISFFKNGKPVHYEVPPALKNYVDNFGATSDPDILTNTVQKLAQMQRKLTTQYSLSFQLKSLVREPVQAIMTSRTNKNFVDGIKQTSLGYVDAFVGKQLEDLTKGLPSKLQFKSYKENWKKQGGTGFQFINMTDEDLQKVAKEMMDTGTAKGNIKYLNPLQPLGKLGETIEAGTRLGEYRSAKRQGYSDEDAFYEATDVTNYKRSGTTVREFNKYIPFLNATVQGNARVMRAIQEAPTRTIARGIGMLSTGALGAYAVRFHDGVSEEQRNELKNLTKWQKEMYTYIPDTREGNENIYAIPKSFAVSQMFATPVERILDDYTNTILDDPSVGDHIKQDLGTLMKSFIPPTEMAGVTTAFELKQNKSLFTGFEIESQYDADKPKKEREAYDQSLVGNFISDGLNLGSEEGWVSPAQVDYVLKDLVGSVGTRGLQAIDQLKENKPVEGLGDVAANPLSQFLLDTRQGGSGLDALKKLESTQDRPDLSKLSKDERAAFDSEENYYNYLKEVEDLNKEVQDVRKNSSLSSEEKSRRIRMIRKEQDRVNRNSIDYFNRLNN